MHIFAVVNLKCFGCVSTMSFLDACLVLPWEGYLSWDGQARLWGLWFDFRVLLRFMEISVMVLCEGLVIDRFDHCVSRFRYSW